MTPVTQMIDYREHWDEYARTWRCRFPEEEFIGDEWKGIRAGAARSLEEYTRLIEREFIAPFIERHHRVLEIGVGGGRTSALLLPHCGELVCADISPCMLRATRQRLGTERVSYVQLDGRSLAGVASSSVDVCFSYDTFVHLDPHDIFQYLYHLPEVLKGPRLCILHHTNVLSEVGWKVFVDNWRHSVGGRNGGALSVMTDSIMERFLSHLGYEVLLKDCSTVPRDCVWVVVAPVQPPLR